jgi:uncharacterized protein YqeY
MVKEIDEQIKSAMRIKNTLQLNVLRALKNAITNSSLQKGNIQESLTDLEVLGIVRKQVSQREESIAQFEKANRQDLIEKEKEEIEILKQFLPQELSESEIENLIQRAINESEATTKKDMGKAIKRAQEIANGRVENKIISKRIGEILR